MGQIFCALVLFFVIFSVEAWSTQTNSEQDDPLCSHDHPLYPYIKLLNVIPEEWKSEIDKSQEKKPVCFTRTITTETDDDGNELNKFSSYEITFGLPKIYESHFGPQQQHSDDGQEFVNYPPFDVTTIKDDITTKKVIYIRCSKIKDDSNTTPEPKIDDTRKSDTTFPPDITTINHDLDFIDDLDEICEDHFDVDILNSLPDDDTTPEPDFGNTRRNSADFVNFTTDVPDTVTTEAQTDTPIEYITVQPEDAEEEEPSILPRMNGTPFTVVTTEVSDLITEILVEMNDPTESTLPTTVQQDYTVSIITLKNAESTSESIVKPEITGAESNSEQTVKPDTNTEQTVQPEITTQQPVTEEVRKSIETITEEEVRKSNEPNGAFVVQMKNIASPNSHAECYLINSKIKYGKCLEPIVPVRILTESKLPNQVKLELVEHLESDRDYDEIIVSGRNRCYLLKNFTSVECPANHEDMTTILLIDDLPDNSYDSPYFTIEFEGRCTTVSKHIDVIECPIYQDTLPHLKTEHLPDHVRLKHAPGVIDVHVDDIVVHSYSHCLLLKTIKDMECRDKPDVVLKEDEYPEYYGDDIRTTDIITDDDTVPTYRLADYSLERLADMFPKSYENFQDSVEYKDPITTPCNSEEDEDDKINSDPINRTTRTLPYPTTDAPVSDRRLKNECDDDDLSCLIQKIKISLIPSTITPTTKVTEITIPNSRKLSKLLKAILDETEEEPLTRSSNVFKPDFIVKISCAQQIFKNTCYYVSKYIMQPTFDDLHDYNKIIDATLLPVDVKIVLTPNLNIFEANETIYAKSGKEKFVLIKKKMVDCPADNKDSFFILDTGSCAAERLEEPSIVKYQKGSRVYCFDFDDDMRLHQVKCPENLSVIPVLSRPQDLKTLCRSQLKNKGHNEQMKLLRRLNIITDNN